jgi:hypothetical protein
MLRVVQCFGKHFSCHLQGDCSLIVTNQACNGWSFLADLLRHGVDGALDVMELIGGTEEQAAIQYKMST